MRLFTALDLPEDIVSRLDSLIGQLRPTAPINWSRAANLHITTKFIGEWPAERLNEVKSALSSLPTKQPLSIEVRGVGFFPNPHSPRVFWAAVHASEALSELARDTDKALSALGIPAESRPYSPHLTLARIKERVPLQSLQQAIAKTDSLDFGSFSAERFYLYLSKLNPGGSVYTKLAEFPLVG